MKKTMPQAVTFMVLTFLVLTLLALVGCAAGISKQSRSQVTYQNPFLDFQKHSQNLMGETVLFGGKIIATQNREGNTELTVLQLALDNRDRPQDDDRSEGRFIVTSDQFLDPAVYAKGYLVTVVGDLVATEERLIGEMRYHYPVIAARELKLWQPGEGSTPRIRFGFGIGATF